MYENKKSITPLIIGLIIAIIIIFIIVGLVITFIDQEKSDKTEKEKIYDSGDDIFSYGGISISKLYHSPEYFEIGEHYFLGATVENLPYDCVVRVHHETYYDGKLRSYGNSSTRRKENNIYELEENIDDNFLEDMIFKYKFQIFKSEDLQKNHGQGAVPMFETPEFSFTIHLK